MVVDEKRQVFGDRWSLLRDEVGWYGLSAPRPLSATTCYSGHSCAVRGRNRVTSPARKRETLLSEMSSTSIQTNPHNIRCKPRTTSHDCSAVMTNTSDYFRAQITHLYIHTTIHSYMRPYTTTTPSLHKTLLRRLFCPRG